MGFIVLEIIKLNFSPLSIVCNKTNTDGMKIINNLEKYVFLLNFDELYAINITTQELPKLYFIGKLLEIDKTRVDDIQVIQKLFHLQISQYLDYNCFFFNLKIEQWHNYFIIVVKCNEKLYVYLIHKHLETGVAIDSIHKIEINAKENDIKLFKYDKDVHLVVFTMKDKEANELT